MLWQEHKQLVHILKYKYKLAEYCLGYMSLVLGRSGPEDHDEFQTAWVKNDTLLKKPKPSVVAHAYHHNTGKAEAGEPGI